MSIDWHKPADPGSVVRAAAVLRPADAGGGGLEATLAAPPGGGAADDRIARLKDALAAAAPSAQDEDRAALERQILAGARSGLAKLDGDEPAENFTLGEHVGLESVILTNGERPSLVIRDGFVDLAAPDIGSWDFNLARFQPAIRSVVASVGRVDVPVKPWYAGTCFVVAPGLVLTNRHVLEAIASQDASGAWTLKWPDQTTVNFNGEEGAAAANGTRFKVVGIAFAGPDPINNAIDFAHLDMAVLRLDPDEARRESPALLEPRPGATLIAVAGGDELPEFRRQTALMANVWHGLGATTRAVAVPGRHHFDVIDELENPDSAMVAALAGSAMALDAYVGLAQRLHRVPPGRPQLVPWANLHDQFGQGYARVRDFRGRFLETLRRVTAVYPDARLAADEKGVALEHSPPPVTGRGETLVGG